MGVGGKRRVPATLAPGKRPSTHSTGGGVSPRDGLAGRGKSRSHQDSILEPSNP
jgi:hypothetical protein